ncbi:hypothetical protein GJAV_G00036060 [Gymnothorax javanicus]|nr:hypothetical protein GJAV_G00036060 [Gymnothorax javanicus]
MLNMDRRTNQRSVCNKKFTERSNLTRHMKIRAPKQNDCDMCGKNFSTKQQLNSHLRQQQYPHIPLYRQGEASRLLYLVIKLLKNRPPANDFSSPHKVITPIKGQNRRIVERVRDGPILSHLSSPLPDLNSKSISSFTAREEKRPTTGQQ